MVQTSDANTAGSMSATAAERIIYAQKSRKWNSTQNPKFLVEFAEQHAANLEWIKQADEMTARKRAEEELKAKEERATKEQTARQHELGKKAAFRGKWIILGAVGVMIALRAWQRYYESTL